MDGVPVSGRTSRESRRQAIEQAKKAEAQRKRRRRLAAWGGAGVGTGIGFAVSGGGSGAASSASSAGSASYAALSTLGTLEAAPSPGVTGPEQVPIPDVQPLAGTSATTAGQAIDGISCQTSEQTIFHIH